MTETMQAKFAAHYAQYLHVRGNAYWTDGGTASVCLPPVFSAARRATAVCTLEVDVESRTVTTRTAYVGADQDFLDAEEEEVIVRVIPRDVPLRREALEVRDRFLIA